MERGELFLAYLGERMGSVQHGTRPVIVVQNNTGNRHSPTVIVVPLTSASKNDIPTHVMIEKQGELTEDSTALAEQIMTIDKDCIIKKYGMISREKMEMINTALKISLGVYYNDEQTRNGRLRRGSDPQDNIGTVPEIQRQDEGADTEKSS